MVHQKQSWVLGSAIRNKGFHHGASDAVLGLRLCHQEQGLPPWCIRSSPGFEALPSGTRASTMVHQKQSWVLGSAIRNKGFHHGASDAVLGFRLCHQEQGLPPWCIRCSPGFEALPSGTRASTMVHQMQSWV